ncbi:helix-hairpin-helix domain-containing protein [Parapedobacter koreensis]|uniref:DNA uptake protein ComE n=1 Tax=Parapedobacter koreensis TaxID=332977 RepID=A0A1H7TU29_9SPHI|nr:helix-hairpin-helix domain-containing protein [Parapedobacter koreensis]SEL88372.1 DNA uptake protein ComE [Parapedobacter koreensis]
MYRWFEKYFAFSRSELTGICVLGVLLLAAWIAPYLYRAWSTPEDTALSAHIDDIERFLATASEPAPAADRIAAAEYFPFDPNGLAVVDWKRLGLSDRQVRMIKNYEAKGGRFRRREDLKKIYAINASDYARLEPYIRIKAAAIYGEPDSATVPSDGGRPPADRSREMVVEEKLYLDLNTADSLDLQALPGIGPVYASRIVRFRDRLGGFHQAEQLLDVYGFDTLRYDGLKTYVYVDTTKVTKIALNLADYAQLNNHPFISAKLANLIIQYRKQHGPYRALTDLLRIAIMDEEIFRKIVPYLTIAND